MAAGVTSMRVLLYTCDMKTKHSLYILSPSLPCSLSFLLFRRRRRRRFGLRLRSCAGSGSDDLISTREASLRREFSVLSGVLRRIEPLDTSSIARSASAPAKDSFKRTISSMLGLLPSHLFSVSIALSPLPLRRLLFSSILTGYTLWNAEYRLSLTRNFETSGGSVVQNGCEVADDKGKERKGVDQINGFESCDGSKDSFDETLRDLSPAVLNYIKELKLELATVEKKLNLQKRENVHLESKREEDSDLLDYLRSLEPEMVNELSQPSSTEVDEIIQQLVDGILKKLFDNETTESFEDPSMGEPDSCPAGMNEHCNVIQSSRDYLAKLLFWCMLLGHHMRGLEHRLHLSSVVGLL